MRIMGESVIGISLSVYILIVSILSPCPPLVNDKNNIGGYLIVSCWVLSSCIFMRVRCLIAARLEKHGKNVLFKYGCSTIMGQIVGGLIMYICVDIYSVFKERDDCSLENYCK